MMLVLACVFVVAVVGFLLTRKRLSGAAKTIVPRLWKLSALAAVVLFAVGLVWNGFRDVDDELPRPYDEPPCQHVEKRETPSSLIDNARVEDVSAQLPTRSLADREPVDCSWHGSQVELFGASTGPSAAEIEDTVFVMDHHLLTDPRNSKKLVNLAWALLREGDATSAFEYFDRAAKSNPSSNVYAERAWAFAYLGKKREALREATRALRIKSTNRLALDCVTTVSRSGFRGCKD